MKIPEGQITARAAFASNRTATTHENAERDQLIPEYRSIPIEIPPVIASSAAVAATSSVASSAAVAATSSVASPAAVAATSSVASSAAVAAASSV